MERALIQFFKLIAKLFALLFVAGTKSSRPVARYEDGDKSEKFFETAIVREWKKRKLMQGVRQSVRLADGTECDIVTSTHAVEVASPSVSDHYSDIGQAIHYARLLNKQPAVVFIVGKNLSREKAFRGLEDLKHAYPESRVWVLDYHAETIGELFMTAEEGRRQQAAYEKAGIRFN